MLNQDTDLSEDMHITEVSRKEIRLVVQNVSPDKIIDFEMKLQ
jgi:hypothetical protein